MPTYRNIGKVPWRRASGEEVPPGGAFEATLREHERVLRRASVYARRLELLDVAEVTAAPTLPVVPLGTPPWPLRMAPAGYLKLHPEGKHAQLARIYVTGTSKKKADT